MKTVSVITGLLAACFATAALADAEVNFKGTLIEAPPCVVNNNENIVVDFGNEVMTTRVDGSNYREKVLFTLDCSEALSSKQKVRISGTTTGFDSQALATSQNGLAIAIYNGATRYTPGEWVNFTDPDLPKFEAVPVKEDGVTLSGGAFNTLASLVVDYQ
jgi:type 1 fimbria pilin